MEYIGWAGIFVGVGLFFGLAAISDSFDRISTSIDEVNENYERWVDAHLPPEPDPEEIAAQDVLNERDDDSPGFDLYGADAEYPDPKDSDLMSPRFEAVWQAIKGWDISRRSDQLYSGPTGNDVMHILRELDKLDAKQLLDGKAKELDHG